MAFPHCPICVVLAFFTLCVVLTRSILIFFLLRGFVDCKNERDSYYQQSKLLLSLE